jgi:hypothetical protein
MAQRNFPAYGQPGYDPGAESAAALTDSANNADALRQQGVAEDLAGQNRNARLISSLPAYGQAMGQSQANELGAAQNARQASLHALLRLVGFGS